MSPRTSASDVTRPPIDDLRRVIDEALAAVKAVDVTLPEFPDVATRLAGAIEQAQRPGRAVVFPEQYEPATERVLRELELFRADLPVDEPIDGAMADLHDRTVDHDPETARAVRGPRGRRLIGGAARRSTPGTTEQTLAAERRSLRRFERRVVEQLARRGLEQPWADLLASTIPVAERELAALLKRRAEYDKTESDRLAAEVAAREAEQQERDARERGAATLAAESPADHLRRTQLIAWFRGHGPAFTFTVSGQSLRGDECADALEVGAPWRAFSRAQETGKARVSR